MSSIQGPDSWISYLKEDALIGPVRHYRTDSPHSESHKKALDVFFVSYTLLQKTILIHFKLSFKELYFCYTEPSSNMAKLASS